MSKIFDEIVEIIEEINDEVEIELDTNLVDEDLLDSLETVTYFSALEEAFDIDISADVYMEKKLSIISNMIAYIKENQ